MKPKALPRKPIKRRIRSLQRSLGIKGIKPRKRRKKGEISKLKAQLWQLCRTIILSRHRTASGKYWRCYTCKRVIRKRKKAQTGHFITSSTCSIELRFDLKNLAIQDYQCNINLSGNWIKFEKNLIKDFGQEYVDELKRRNEETKGKIYPPSWFENKIAEYQQISLMERKLPSVESSTS